MSDPTVARGWREFGEHMGGAYLRYSFTKGTVHEVDLLVDLLTLEPGARVLDVGCGPGRHSNELARRGFSAHGIDLSDRFVNVAQATAMSEGLGGASFEAADATELVGRSDLHGYFDAAISWCQGAFGSLPPSPFSETGGAAGDLAVLRGMLACIHPGGAVAVGSFSALFQARHLEDSDEFDPLTGHNVEQTELRSETGERRPAELDTTCFTPREVALLMERAGLSVEGSWSHTPGRRALRQLNVDEPEFVTLARRVR